MKYLVIVESPTKIAKLQQILPKNYIIVATYGHIMDLDPKVMSLDLNDNFKPVYKFYYESLRSSSDRKKKKVNADQLVKAFSSCDKLIIASDLDDEGEFIGQSVLKLLKPKTYERIVFNAITKDEVNKALKNSSQLSQPTLDAQKTRRFMDRIFGYGLSDLLERVPGIGNAKNLGCGRVQSIIVKIIIQQDDLVNKALESSNLLFFEGFGEMNVSTKETSFNVKTYLANKNGKKFKVPSNKTSALLFNDLVSGTPLYKWTISNVKESMSTRSPKPPFTTPTLQCTGANELRWPVKKIMDVAQILYQKGFITYMRTDATTLSKEALDGCEKYIKKEYGNTFYKRKQYEVNDQSAQEAHEAIRPTNFDNCTKTLDIDQKKLYDLIWKRTIASQMENAIVKNLKFTFVPKQFFVERGFRMIGNKAFYEFKGFTIVYNEKNNDEEENDEITDTQITEPQNAKITCLKMTVKESTKMPPSRLTESRLVKIITANGIGRPATTASFITKIQEKDYVRVENTEGKPIRTLKLSYDKNAEQKYVSEIVTLKIGSEKKRLVPTSLGRMVNDFLEENFPHIMDIHFTANFEKNLSDIKSGKKEWLQVLHDFYNSIKPQIELVRKKYNVTPKTYSNDDIVGQYKGQNILYIKNKFGTSIMVEIDGNKIWAKTSVKPTESEAIKLIEERKVAPKTTVLKQLNKKYTIRESSKGPFLQVSKGKKVKFAPLKGIDIDKLTIAECNKIASKLFK